MPQFLKTQLLRFLPSAQAQVSSDDVIYGERLDRLSILSCLAVPSFMGVFAWFALWPLMVAMGVCGVFLIAAPLVYRKSGSILLGRESFLVALFVFKFYEILYFGTILAPGSVWLVALPVIAVMVGSMTSGLVWMFVTVAAIVSFGFINDVLAIAPPIDDTGMQTLFGFSLIYLIICLSIFVFLVDYERRLAMVGLARMNETVRQLVISDPLTGMFNRRHIGDLIADDDARPPEARAIGAVLMIDIDHFKSINDRFGHFAGDSVIKAVAGVIAQVAGERNPVGRFGGEEFVCLVQPLPEAWNEVGAAEIAEAIRRRVSTLVVDAIPDLRRVTVSVGYAESALFGGTQAALPEADFALYAAKAAGRDCARGARPELERRLARAV